MKLVLKNFSQDVDIANPDDAKNYLVFIDEEGGKTLRLPVGMETIGTLVSFVQGLRAGPEYVPPEPEDAVPAPQGYGVPGAVPDEVPENAEGAQDEGATVFGGEEEEGQELEPDDTALPPPKTRRAGAPRREEEVPQL